MADTNATADNRTYVYLAVDLRTGETIDSIPFNSMVFTEGKNRASTFSAATPLTTQPHASAANKITRDALLPGARKIVTMRDGEAVSINILWTADVADVNPNVISFGGAGPWQYIANRRNRLTKTYSGDQFDIVSSIVSDAQSNAQQDVGLLVTNDGLSGVSRTEKVISTERRKFGEIVTQVSGADDGFDFIERASGTEKTGFTSELFLATSLNVNRPNVSVEIGRNARALGYKEDAFHMENAIDYAGQHKTGSAPVFGFASSAASLAVYPQMDGYARAEITPDQGSAFLASLARQRLVRRETPVRNVTIELETGIGAGSGISATYVNTGIGSVFSVACDYGWLEFEEPMRVEGRRVSVNDTGKETIMLEMTNRID